MQTWKSNQVPYFTKYLFNLGEYETAIPNASVLEQDKKIKLHTICLTFQSLIYTFLDLWREIAKISCISS